METMKNITILGYGHGGMALSAELKLKGNKAALWSDPLHMVLPLLIFMILILI